LTIEAGMIFCLNAQTGCTYWVMQPGAAVRAAVTVGALPAGSAAKYALYFGDEKSNVQAVDALTGKLLWKTKIENHFLSRITGSPVLYRDRIYVPSLRSRRPPGRDCQI
jgi:polyvinyl alcohol dehydrogenase (cytochrome)